MTKKEKDAWQLGREAAEKNWPVTRRKASYSPEEEKAFIQGWNEVQEERGLGGN